MAELLGIPEFKRALSQLALDLRKKVIRKALRAGAKVVQAQAKANAPVRTGLMRRRIVVMASKLRKAARGEVGVYLTVRATKKARATKDRRNDPFYFKFQEQGFHAVGRRRVGGGRKARAAKLASGQYRFIEGKKFLGNAFAAKRNEALQVILGEVRAHINAQNKRV
jgi:HK97 gp10 family phage protein